jgi:hypothetical protein
MVWITYDMGSAADGSCHYYSLLAVCAVVILLGLAAHLIGDAAGRSFDIAQAASSGLMTCSLLAGLMTLQAAAIGMTMARAAVLIDYHLNLPRWFSAPPVRPPISLCRCVA